jgi:hypothetical protein
LDNRAARAADDGLLTLRGRFAPIPDAGRLAVRARSKQEGASMARDGRPDLVDLGHHELGGFELRPAVEVRHLVERALQGALGRGAVVADDAEDQRVVEDVQLLQGVDEPADVIVRVLKETPPRPPGPSRRASAKSGFSPPTRPPTSARTSACRSDTDEVIRIAMARQ